MAPAAAAMASRNDAETRFQRTWLISLSAGAFPVAGPCANAETASRSSTAVITIVFLFTPISSFFELFELVFFRRRGPTDVDHGQHDEDERLKKGAEDPERHHRPGHDQRDQSHEYPGGGVLAEDIAEETHRERQDAREVADQFDREHQGREPPH